MMTQKNLTLKQEEPKIMLPKKMEQKVESLQDRKIKRKDGIKF